MRGSGGGGGGGGGGGALSGQLVQSSVCPVLGMGHPDRRVSVASAYWRVRFCEVATSQMLVGKTRDQSSLEVRTFFAVQKHPCSSKFKCPLDVETTVLPYRV